MTPAAHKIYLKRMFKNRSTKRNSGFTLIELLVVISLVGILSGVTLLILNPKKQQQVAEDGIRQSNLEKLSSGIEAYASANGEYPAQDDMIPDSNNKPTGLEAAVFISKIPNNEPTQGVIYTYSTPSDRSSFSVWVSKASDPAACFKYQSDWGKLRDCTQCSTGICSAPTPTPTSTSAPTPIAPTPTFNPAAGAIAFGTTVTITSAGADAIYYTTNGSTPTTSSTRQSTTPLVINAAVIVKALAIRGGYANSAIGSATYTEMLMVVGSIHTTADCVSAGGTLFNVTGDYYLCKFTGVNVSCPTVPTVWTQYSNWQQYSTVGGYCDTCGRLCTSGPLSFTDSAGYQYWGAGLCEQCPNYLTSNCSQEQGAWHWPNPATLNWQGITTNPSTERMAIGCY